VLHRVVFLKVVPVNTAVNGIRFRSLVMLPFLQAGNYIKDVEERKRDAFYRAFIGACVRIHHPLTRETSGHREITWQRV
jgi:hypothetical protein